jgi:outer membrane protein, heavy metal efflux system
MNKRMVLSTLLLIQIASVAFAQQLPELTLQRVVDAYIQNSLEVQAARFKLERSRADQVAARLRPNPSLSITAENMPVSGPTSFGDLYEIGATYTDTIELGGKKSLRENAANATVTAAEAQFEDTMRRGLADTKRLYYEAVLSRQNLEVAIESRQTFDQLVQFNVTRFQEGAIPEVELIKVRLERLKFESSVKQAELGLRQATIRLIEKLGSSASFSQQVGGELSFRPLALNLNSIREFALAQRTDVLASIAEVAAANQRLALERGRSKPDLSPFAGYKRVGNDNTLLVGINIPLKVRDRNEGEIARAEADVKSAQVRLQLVRNRAVAELESAYAALQASRELVETFQSDLLRQADESRSITLAAYEEGGIELLPVLDAQRTRSDVRQQYLKTLFEYQASIVELELAAGRELQP